MDIRRIFGDHHIGPLRGDGSSTGGESIDEGQNEYLSSLEIKKGFLRSPNIKETQDLPSHISSPGDLDNYINDLTATITMLLSSGDPTAIAQARKMIGSLDVANKQVSQTPNTPGFDLNEFLKQFGINIDF